ncbi:Uncharacterised protein [Vibrio cholerae]|nr:Uncharacterised protein [Vibrio cholerae]
MHPIHKAMKMNPKLLFCRQGFKKSIHKIGFTASDTSPHIETLWRLRHCWLLTDELLPYRRSYHWLIEVI